jgi:hypothetical protein
MAGSWRGTRDGTINILGNKIYPTVQGVMTKYTASKAVWKVLGFVCGTRILLMVKVPYDHCTIILDLANLETKGMVTLKPIK